ncbi:MAG: mannose-1-phosphate guanylyltransferase [Candidatus Pacebacteria bacterium CG_4_10_14_0_8_um_filter_42_14]|nr:MAG: mannose-1-phosphate guanylyltransferase [Candidatus Pacebacteria bacterium CG_4_10_14_0_8_um_filter_42_14]
MTQTDHTYAVLLAGGGGTRLWPKSRNKTPKQFLKLFGEETMLQYTVNRVRKLVSWERLIIVTNEKYRAEVEKQLPEVPKNNIISEPEKKDTALAMLVGSLYAQSLDPKAVVINSASDHVVADVNEFVRVMQAAVRVASKGENLVTVGITPSRPATGFGYIKIGEDLAKLDRGLSLFTVASFTEKPNEATARGFISTGKYFWNANMYVWSAKALVAAFEAYLPSLYKSTKVLSGLKGQDFAKKLPKIYAAAETISIDYAISEKATNLVLIPGDFGWNDVGDWKIVYDLEKKDISGNVIVSDDEEAKVVALASYDNLIHANGRLVALVGVNDMIVVDTDEIVLVIPKSKSQDVKKIVEHLKATCTTEYL